MLHDTPIPDELRLVEHDAVPFHAGQKATAKSAISRAANERKSGEVRLPMFCQPTSFFFGLDGRVFDDKVQAERLVCRDDDLLMRKRTGAATGRERQYISLSEGGQALQLCLTMVYMYAEDVVRLGFQFVMPLHKLG